MTQDSNFDIDAILRDAEAPPERNGKLPPPPDDGAIAADWPEERALSGEDSYLTPAGGDGEATGAPQTAQDYTAQQLEKVLVLVREIVEQVRDVNDLLREHLADTVTQEAPPAPEELPPGEVRVVRRRRPKSS